MADIGNPASTAGVTSFTQPRYSVQYELHSPFGVHFISVAPLVRPILAPAEGFGHKKAFNAVFAQFMPL